VIFPLGGKIADRLKTRASIRISELECPGFIFTCRSSAINLFDIFG